MAHYMTEMTTIISDWQNISRNDEWVWAPVSLEWWEIIQLILAIIGILGNLLVMLVIFWPGRRRCATDTLIGALAVADFLTSIFIIPLPKVILYPDTIAAGVFCKIIKTSVLMWISICASIFTLTTIAIERLVAVRFPFWFQRLFSSKRTSIAVIVIWIASVVFNIFSINGFSVNNGKCVHSSPSVGFQQFFGVFLFLVVYVLPVGVMVTANAWTIYVLRQRRATALRKVKKRVLQTLLIVVITFIVCWTADQYGFLIFNLGIVDFTFIFSPLYRCFVILAFCNSCANPFIYAARLPNFRKALKDVFWRKSLRHGHGVHIVFAGEGEECPPAGITTKSRTTETIP